MSSGVDSSESKIFHNTGRPSGIFQLNEMTN